MVGNAPGVSAHSAHCLQAASCLRANQHPKFNGVCTDGVQGIHQQRGDVSRGAGSNRGIWWCRALRSCSSWLGGMLRACSSPSTAVAVCPALAERIGMHSSALTSKLVATYTEPSRLGNPGRVAAAACCGSVGHSLPFWPCPFRPHCGTHPFSCSLLPRIPLFLPAWVSLSILRLSVPRCDFSPGLSRAISGLCAGDPGGGVGISRPWPLAQPLPEPSR